MVAGGGVVVVVIDVVVDVTFHSMETRRSSADPSREEAAQTIPLPPGLPENPPTGVPLGADHLSVARATQFWW